MLFSDYATNKINNSRINDMYREVKADRLAKLALAGREQNRAVAGDRQTGLGWVGRALTVVLNGLAAMRRNRPLVDTPVSSSYVTSQGPIR